MPTVVLIETKLLIFLVFLPACVCNTSVVLFDECMLLFRQFDLRMPHSCSREVNNVLVNLLNHLGRYAEAKCLAINPQRPELLAVGANDPYIRLYDRRMIKPTTVEVYFWCFG